MLWLGWADPSDRYQGLEGQVAQTGHTYLQAGCCPDTYMAARVQRGGRGLLLLPHLLLHPWAGTPRACLHWTS